MSKWSFLYEDNWEQYCRENNIENPFYKEYKIFQERLRPQLMPFGESSIKTINVLPATEEQLEAESAIKKDRDEYIKKKNSYIAEIIFYEVGYNEFEEFVIECHLDLLDNEKFKPCLSADGQCNLFCKKYLNCEPPLT